MLCTYEVIVKVAYTYGQDTPNCALLLHIYMVMHKIMMNATYAF